VTWRNRAEASFGRFGSRESIYYTQISQTTSELPCKTSLLSEYAFYEGYSNMKNVSPRTCTNTQVVCIQGYILASSLPYMVWGVSLHCVRQGGQDQVCGARMDYLK
jgi:hypothetical protein